MFRLSKYNIALEVIYEYYNVHTVPGPVTQELVTDDLTRIIGHTRRKTVCSELATP